MNLILNIFKGLVFKSMKILVILISKRNWNGLFEYVKYEIFLYDLINEVML